MGRIGLLAMVLIATVALVGCQASSGGDARVTSDLAANIDEYTVEKVAVNFIENEVLGGNSLLGMSFLGRFRFTLDGDNNQLILLAK